MTSIKQRQQFFNYQVDKNQNIDYLEFARMTNFTDKEIEKCIEYKTKYPLFPFLNIDTDPKFKIEQKKQYNEFMRSISGEQWEAGMLAHSDHLSDDEFIKDLTKFQDLLKFIIKLKKIMENVPKYLNEPEQSKWYIFWCGRAFGPLPFLH